MNSVCRRESWTGSKVGRGERGCSCCEGELRVIKSLSMCAWCCNRGGVGRTDISRLSQGIQGDEETLFASSHSGSSPVSDA